MRFEYDRVKSLSNKAKHGVDFDEAQQLWSDPNCVFAPTFAGPEPRFWQSARSEAESGRRSSRGAAITSGSYQFVARERMRLSDMKKISAEAFDAKFDAGEDISGFVDWSRSRRPAAKFAASTWISLAGSWKRSTGRLNISA
jgi:hypothetical protein